MKPHRTAPTVRLTATLAACLALAACTTTPAAPAWVPGQQATVSIWRRSGGNAPPAHDAQGRARLYLQDEKQRAQRGALAQLGEYVYVVASEGPACSR